MRMLPVCQTRDLWPNERNVDLHSYITWNNIHPSFLTRRIAGVGRLHRTLPLSTQRGAQKRKSVVFRVKLYFTWRKSATKFLCVKTASKNAKMKETRAHIVISHETSFILVFLTRRIVGGGDFLYLKFLGRTDPVGAKTPIFNRYSPIAP